MVTSNVRPSVQLLKDVKLFKTFTEAELGQLISMGSSVSYEAHANIVIEGELTWGLYIILEGYAGVLKANKLTGDTYDVAQLRAGAYFGEMSLIEDAPRSATVRALTDIHLFMLSKESFTQFLNSSQELKMRFYEGCIAELSSRLRELDENYVVSQYQLWKSAIAKQRREAA